MKVENPHAGRPEVRGARDLIYFDSKEQFLFDADTGRMWSDERLAA